MGTWKPKPVLEGMFSAADFEDISSWLDSPAGQLSDKVNRIVCRLLRKADVDVDNRKIIWPDGQRLSISDSVSRIHASHPSLPLDMIDSHVLDWLTMEFVPKGYAPEQMDEFERLAGEWADDHEFGRIMTDKQS